MTLGYQIFVLQLKYQFHLYQRVIKIFKREFLNYQFFDFALEYRIQILPFIIEIRVKV